MTVPSVLHRPPIAGRSSGSAGSDGGLGTAAGRTWLSCNGTRVTLTTTTPPADAPAREGTGLLTTGTPWDTGGEPASDADRTSTEDACPTTADVRPAAAPKIVVTTRPAF